MYDWEQRTLGKLSEIVRGASPRPIQDPKWFDSNSNVGWLRISDVTAQNGRIYYLEQKISKVGQEKTRVLTEPHLLLSIAATVGKPVVNHVNTGVHDGFLIFLNPLFDREYMFQWLEMFRPKWQKYGQPGSQVNLNSELVRNQEIMIPSMKEQIQIGTFFKKLDDTIALHQRKLTLLEQLKQTYLADMFPQSQESIPILRFTGHSEPWEQRKLGELVSKAIDNRGKTPPTQEKGIYPLLEVGSIGGYSPDYSKVSKYVDDDTYNTWFRAHLKENDILFSTVGNTGLATLMDNFEGATVAQNIVGFRAKESAVPEFLLQMFKLPSNLKKAKSIEMGAVQPSIKVSQLIHVEYHIPTSKEEQAKIGAFFKRLDDTIALLQEKIAHLKVLKNTLLNKMFI